MMDPEADMEMVQKFNEELLSMSQVALPISKAKMAQITRYSMSGAKMYKYIVHSVEKFINTCPPEYKLPGLYVIDSILRHASHQFGRDNVYQKRFEHNLPATFRTLFHRCIPADKPKVVRVLNIWQKNRIFVSDIIQPLLDLANPNAQVQLKDNSPEGKSRPSNETSGKSVNSGKIDTSIFAKHSLTSLVSRGTELLNTGNGQYGPETHQLVDTLIKLSQRDEFKRIKQFELEQNDDPPAQSTLPAGDDTDENSTGTPTEAEPQYNIKRSNKQRTKQSRFHDEVLNALGHLQKESAGNGNSASENGSITVPSVRGVPPPLGAFSALKSEPDFNPPTRKEAEMSPDFATNWGTAVQQFPPGKGSRDTDSRIKFKLNCDPQSKRSSANKQADDYRQEHSSSRREPKNADVDYRSSRFESRERGRSRSRSRSPSPANSVSSYPKSDDGKPSKGVRTRKRDNCMTAFSTTIWVGHIPKYISENKIIDLFHKMGTGLLSIKTIPSRGCAYLNYRSREDANKVYAKLSISANYFGTTLKFSWAPGLGLKENNMITHWETVDGVAFIPHLSLPLHINWQSLGAGSTFEEDTVPAHFKASYTEYKQSLEFESQIEKPNIAAQLLDRARGGKGKVEESPRDRMTAVGQPAVVAQETMPQQQPPPPPPPPEMPAMLPPMPPMPSMNPSMPQLAAPEQGAPNGFAPFVPQVPFLFGMPPPVFGPVQVHHPSGPPPEFAPLPPPWHHGSANGMPPVNAGHPHELLPNGAPPSYQQAYHQPPPPPPSLLPPPPPPPASQLNNHSAPVIAPPPPFQPLPPPPPPHPLSYPFADQLNEREPHPSEMFHLKRPLSPNYHNEEEEGPNDRYQRPPHDFTDFPVHPSEPSHFEFQEGGPGSGPGRKPIPQLSLPPGTLPNFPDERPFYETPWDDGPPPPFYDGPPMDRGELMFHNGPPMPPDFDDGPPPPFGMHFNQPFNRGPFNMRPMRPMHFPGPNGPPFRHDLGPPGPRPPFKRPPSKFWNQGPPGQMWRSPLQENRGRGGAQGRGTMRNSNWKAPVPSRLKRNNGSDNGQPDDRGDDSQDGQDMDFAETAPADLANMNMETTEPTGPAFADSQPMFDLANESNFTDAPPPAESVNLENAVQVNCESNATAEVS